MATSGPTTAARPDWRATMPRPRRPAWLPAVMLAIAATMLALAVAAWIAWQPASPPSVVVDLPADMAPPPANAAGRQASDLAARDVDGPRARAAAEKNAAEATSGQAHVETAASAPPPGTEAGDGDGGGGSAAQGGEEVPAQQQLAAEDADRQADLAAALAAEQARGGPYQEPDTVAAEDGGGEIAEEPFIEVPLVVTRGSNLRSRPSVNSTRLMWVATGSGALLLDPEPVRGYYRVSTGEREGWIWHINVEPADLAPSDEEQAGETPASGAGLAGEDAPSTDVPAAEDASAATKPATLAEPPEAPAAAGAVR